MKDLRIKYFIFSILAMLSIISVGFAAWVSTSESTTINIDGNIKVDDITSNNDYIKCNNLEMFQFFRNGFVKDNKLSKQGDIIVSLSFQNLSKFVIHQELNISLFLEYDNLNIFKKNSQWLQTTVAIKDQNNNLLNNISFSYVSDTTLEVTFQVDNNLISNNELNYTLIYSFSYSSDMYNESFRVEMYPTLIKDLINNKLKFKFSALIKGD